MLRRIVAAAFAVVTIALGATAGNAAPLPTASAGPAVPLPGIPSNAELPVVEQNPSTLTFGMDGSLVVKDVGWTGRTDTSGEATGTIEVNTCDPNCAAGQYVSQRVNLVFQVVTPGEEPYFNCVRIELPEGPVRDQFKAAQLNLPLSPAAYGGSIDCGPTGS